jgi:hypothetical protein
MKMSPARTLLTKQPVCEAQASEDVRKINKLRKVAPWDFRGDHRSSR